MIRDFQSDYRRIDKVLHNQRPERLPLFEHHINKPFIEKIIGREIELFGNKPGDYENYYCQTIGFWKDMTYDSEAAICGLGASLKNRSDYRCWQRRTCTTTIPRVMEEDANLLTEKIKTTKSKTVNVIFDYLPQENYATIMHQAVLNAFRKLNEKKIEQRHANIR